MSKQYCFDIENPDNVDFDPNALKEYVRGLYMGRGKDMFNKDNPPPFVMLFVNTLDGKNVCIRLTTRGRENIKRIERINKKFTPSKLNWRGLKLTQPSEWGTLQQNWWDTEKPKKPGEKWVSIIQRGPYFTHLETPYQPLGGKLMYAGRTYKLTPEEEKVAMLYAKRLVSEKSGGVVDRLTKDSVFNKNFWTDFKTYLTPEHKRVFKDFNKIGWRDLIKKVETLKDHKPTSEEKRAKLIRNEEKKREYGYARLDGNLEEVGNYTVEPVGLFMGRGKNPLRGKIKREVNPEDVTINIGVDDPIPAPPAGHRWDRVIHDQKVSWLAKWKDSITGEPKYVQFAATGKFKGKSDLAKYEKARKLQRHIDTVRKTYMADAASTNDEKMQLGTVLWLIDNHGIRPGDERTEDQADTVGASTLRVGHVKLLSGNTIKFEFLGKDSIKFEKSMKVPTLIYANFKKLLSGRSKDAQVFNLISAGSINAYLKQFDVKFSNKVFRTRLASHIMFEALQDVKIPEGATKKKTKMLFNKANVKVADVLNHTRSISMKAQQATKKLKDKLRELKVQLRDAKKEGKSKKSIDAIKKRIAAKKESIEAKEDTKSVAINTSLTNYIDPRIVVAWAKKQITKGKKSEREERLNKILEAVYSKAMLKKFQWAIQSSYVTKDWNWLTSPLQGPSELQPVQAHPSGGRPKPKTKPGPKPKPKPKPQLSTDKKGLRAWCRKKYGDHWYEVDKKERLEEARKALSQGFLPTPPLTPSSTPPPQYIEDYKLLLRACKSDFKDIGRLQKLHRVKTGQHYTYPALDWLYPFTTYAVQKNKGNVRISKKFNQLYNLLTRQSSSGLSPREGETHPHLEHLKLGRSLHSKQDQEIELERQRDELAYQVRARDKVDAANQAAGEVVQLAGSRRGTEKALHPRLKELLGGTYLKGDQSPPRDYLGPYFLIDEGDEVRQYPVTRLGGALSYFGPRQIESNRPATIELKVQTGDLSDEIYTLLFIRPSAFQGAHVPDEAMFGDFAWGMPGGIDMRRQTPDINRRYEITGDSSSKTGYPIVSLYRPGEDWLDGDIWDVTNEWHVIHGNMPLITCNYDKQLLQLSGACISGVPMEFRVISPKLTPELCHLIQGMANDTVHAIQG